MPLRFLYFDAGFTLLHPWPSVGHHYAEVAAEWSVSASAPALDAAFRGAWRGALAGRDSALPYGRNLAEARVFWAGVVTECFRLAGAAAPTEQAFHDAVFDRFAEARCWRLYPDVNPALALLEERGIPFGVLSNWDPRLRPVLDALGLGPRLSALVISSEAGCEKPRPGIYQVALRAAGNPEPASIGLIGDEPESDGHGALRAGWRQCLILREPGALPPAGLIVRNSLTDAVAALL